MFNENLPCVLKNETKEQNVLHPNKLDADG